MPRPFFLLQHHFNPFHFHWSEVITLFPPLIDRLRFPHLNRIIAKLSINIIGMWRFPVLIWYITLSHDHFSTREWMWTNLWAKNGTKQSKKPGPFLASRWVQHSHADSSPFHRPYDPIMAVGHEKRQIQQFNSPTTLSEFKLFGGNRKENID